MDLLTEAFEVRLDWVRGAFEKRLTRAQALAFYSNLGLSDLRSVREAFGLSFEVR